MYCTYEVNNNNIRSFLPDRKNNQGYFSIYTIEDNFRRQDDEKDCSYPPVGSVDTERAWIYQPTQSCPNRSPATARNTIRNSRE